MSTHLKHVEKERGEIGKSESREAEVKQTSMSEEEKKNFVFHPDKADRVKNAPFSFGGFNIERIYTKMWLTRSQRRWREYEAVQSMGLVSIFHPVQPFEVLRDVKKMPGEMEKVGGATLTLTIDFLIYQCRFVFSSFRVEVWFWEVFDMLRRFASRDC